jgi:Icc-related predicted phosphoesterase
MKILAVSDTEIGFLYSPVIKDRFRDVNLIISCGDLPFFYLEYMVSMLNVPLLYVHGNHANREIQTTGAPKRKPEGGQGLHGMTVNENGALLAGVDGCLQYNYGPYQYSQSEMWFNVFRLIPGMMRNKLRFGRYLDVFVTHAPPWHIHDQEDRPHQGSKAFIWFDTVFQPQYHLHGHIHVYRNDTIITTQLNRTVIQNVYGYREIILANGR